MLKVLGKEFEEEPFFKRVFLNITCKSSIRVPPLSCEALFFMIPRKHEALLTVELSEWI